jgi:hypothetical protein
VEGDSKLGRERKAEAERLQRVLEPLGIVPGPSTSRAVRHWPMLADGSPACPQPGRHTLFRYPPHADDTLAMVDKKQLQQNVAAWTASLAVLAGPITPRPAPRTRTRRPVKRGALIGAALLLGACSEGPTRTFRRCRRRLRKRPESLMTEAERAARSAKNRASQR